MERPRQVEAGSLEASLLQLITDHNHASVELCERTGKLASSPHIASMLNMVMCFYSVVMLSSRV